MTPEDRARQLVNGKDWLLQLSDAVTETGDALTIEIVSEPLLEQLIADAIREAVRVEREACARLADQMASRIVNQSAGAHDISGFEQLNQIARVCREAAERIRQREDG